MPIQAIPDGHSTVIPYLLVADAGGLIEFLKRAFDAREVHRSTTPDGTVMHAHVRVGDSSIMLGQSPPGRSLSTTMFYMYVNDVDALYEKVLKAGAASVHAPADQFYGDRAGAVKDPAGNEWWIATHKQDISEDELARRAAAARNKR